MSEDRTELQLGARKLYNALVEAETYCSALDKIAGGQAIARKAAGALDVIEWWVTTIMHPADGAEE